MSENVSRFDSWVMTIIAVVVFIGILSFPLSVRYGMASFTHVATEEDIFWFGMALGLALYPPLDVLRSQLNSLYRLHRGGDVE